MADANGSSASSATDAPLVIHDGVSLAQPVPTDFEDSLVDLVESLLEAQPPLPAYAELLSVAQQMRDRWTPLQTEDVMSFARRMFGFDSRVVNRHMDTLRTLETERKKLLVEPAYLMKLAIKFQRHGTEEEEKTVKHAIYDLQNTIQRTFDLLKNEASIYHAANPTQHGPVEDFCVTFAPLDADSCTPFTLFKLHVLDRCAELGYRKHGNNLYVERFVEIDGKRHGTRSWTQVEGGLAKFCQQQASISKGHAQFLNSETVKSGPKVCANELAAIEDPRLPWLEKQRGAWSFRNGVYCAHWVHPTDGSAYYDEFLQYGVKPLPAEMVTLRFYDENFTSVRRIGGDYSVDASEPRVYHMDVGVTLDLRVRLAAAMRPATPPASLAWMFKDGVYIFNHTHKTASGAESTLRNVFVTNRNLWRIAPVRAVACFPEDFPLDVLAQQATVTKDDMAECKEATATVIAPASAPATALKSYDAYGLSDSGDEGADDGMDTDSDSDEEDEDLPDDTPADTDDPLPLALPSHVIRSRTVTFASGLQLSALAKPPPSYMDIQTPVMDKLLGDQGLTREQQLVFWVLVGRALFPVGELDDWQVIMFIEGMAGTGKSVILELMSKFYDPSDVYAFSNKCEEKFGIYPAWNKLLWIAPEIKRDFSMDQAAWQSMVTGEVMSLPIKAQTAISVKWDVPGCMSGNELPQWQNNSGSVVRRIILFTFGTKITHVDTTLDAKLLREIKQHVRKAALAYFHTIDRLGVRKLHDILPAYFSETSRKLGESTHELSAFLSAHQLSAGPCETTYMPRQDFVKLFNAWCTSENLPQKRLSEDYCRGVFGDRGIRVTEVTKRLYNGRMREYAWIEGVDLLGRSGASASAAAETSTETAASTAPVAPRAFSVTRQLP